MKKLVLFAVAVIAISFASCGNNAAVEAAKAQATADSIAAVKATATADSIAAVEAATAAEAAKVAQLKADSIAKTAKPAKK